MDRKDFDIQPIGRFYEASATIRRPKVSLVYILYLILESQCNHRPGNRMFLL